jgi:hypothetical protein
MNSTNSAEPKWCYDSRKANFETTRGSDNSRILDRNVEIVSASYANCVPAIFLMFNSPNL